MSEETETTFPENCMLNSDEADYLLPLSKDEAAMLKESLCLTEDKMAHERPFVDDVENDGWANQCRTLVARIKYGGLIDRKI